MTVGPYSPNDDFDDVELEIELLLNGSYPTERNPTYDPFQTFWLDTKYSLVVKWAARISDTLAPAYVKSGHARFEPRQTYVGIFNASWENTDVRYMIRDWAVDKADNVVIHDDESIELFAPICNYPDHWKVAADAAHFQNDKGDFSANALSTVSIAVYGRCVFCHTVANLAAARAKEKYLAGGAINLRPEVS